MKRQLTVALGLAVIATPALASKARLEALGEDNYGSYYVHDNRNIFLNPAKINDNKDLVTFEFGSTSSNSSNSQDGVNTPRSEGGLIKSHGNLVYGLHFGNSTPSAVVVRTLGAASAAQYKNAQEVTPWDFFIGGDAGVKWGANFTYENFDGTTNGNRLSSTGLRTRFGVVAGDSEAFAQVSLNGDAKDRTNNREIDGKAAYMVGLGHVLNGYKLFVDYKKIEADYGTLASQDSTWDLQEWRLGVARQEKLNDKATLFAKAQLNYLTVSDDNAGNLASTSTPALTTIDGKVKQTTLPVTAGLEYDALSWLVLRTSVSHTVYGQRDVKGGNPKKSTVAATAVRAGASLRFGELTVDGLVSTDAQGDGVAATDTQADTNGGAGNLRTDNLLARASVTYRF